MDINKWLAETAEAVEPARKPDHPGSLAIARHPKKAPVLDLPFSKRRAKRRKVVSKDSSILAPEDIPTEAPARYIAPHAHQYSDCSVLSEDAGHTSMREDGPHNAANPYQRRKRHKTKADRYDPKPRSPSMRQEDGGKQKRKSTERDKEARRPKKGKAAPSVIRNFHAANVPRERLTVRSLDTAVGLVQSVDRAPGRCSLERISEYSRKERRQPHFEVVAVSSTLQIAVSF